MKTTTSEGDSRAFSLFLEGLRGVDSVCLSCQSDYAAGLGTVPFGELHANKMPVLTDGASEM